MFEKVNPSHPDKIADRIAGAIVDLAYAKEKNPKVAIEVLIGHGVGYVTGECSCNFNYSEIYSIVHRIAPNIDKVISNIVKQDAHLANNQFGAIRCGDNGIFKGVPVTDEQKTLSSIAHDIYKSCPYDGKYIINNDDLIIWNTLTNSDEHRSSETYFYDIDEEQLYKLEGEFNSDSIQFAVTEDGFYFVSSHLSGGSFDTLYFYDHDDKTIAKVHELDTTHSIIPHLRVNSEGTAFIATHENDGSKLYCFSKD